MSLEGPKPCHFWDATTNSWRPARTGEAGELVWNSTTCSWEPGAIGGNWKWNTTTRSWAPGPGGTHIWNGTTWAPNEDEGYGGSHYWNGTAWLPNRGLSFGVLAISGLQALYDPSDLTSLYQSRTGGSTGAVDSVVGIMLDKSEMGGRTAAAFIAGQTELRSTGTISTIGAPTLATYDTGTGAGVTNRTDSSNVSGVLIAVTTPAWLIFDIEKTAGAGNFDIRSGSVAGVSILGGTFITARETRVLYVASGSGAYITCASNGGTASFTLHSVKSLPGYHALAPSDAARGILRSASGKYYLDLDGTDDWMNVFPTLNLGEQWWHVGGWQADANDDWYFSTSATYRGGPRALLTRVDWTNSADVTTQIFAGSVTTPHIVTIQQASTTSLSGRYNGGTVTTITPYDDTGSSQGLALFTSSNSGFSAGLDGRFYGGAFGTGSISSSDRALLERYVAGLTGVTL